MKRGGNGIFYDIQDFEQVSTDFALSSNLLQVDKGVPTICHDCIQLEDLILRRLQISHAMVDEFRIRDGWTTFVLSPARYSEALWNGVQSPPNVLGMVRSGMDHAVLMPAGWSTIEIDVADHLIASEGLLPESVLSGATNPEKGMLRLRAPAAAAARQDLLASLAQDVSPTTAVLSEDPARALRRRVLDLLAQAAEFGSLDDMVRPVSLSYQACRLVRKARAMLDDQVTGNPTIDSVAYELGVTTRSLQRCFRSVLGMSPKQYFLARKLDTARRAMRHCSQAATVVDIAYEFGFVSASRFAEQFLQRFGRSPSEVIRLTFAQSPSNGTEMRGAGICENIDDR